MIHNFNLYTIEGAFAPLLFNVVDFTYTEFRDVKFSSDNMAFINSFVELFSKKERIIEIQLNTL